MNKKLADAIARDNEREDAGMHPDDRSTCYTHQAWADACADQHRRPTAGQLLNEAIELERTRRRV